MDWPRAEEYLAIGNQVHVAKPSKLNIGSPKPDSFQLPGLVPDRNTSISCPNLSLPQHSWEAKPPYPQHPSPSPR